MKFMIVTTDEQGSPVVIGPVSGHASDDLYDEIESWGWTVQAGAHTC